MTAAELEYIKRLIGDSYEKLMERIRDLVDRIATLEDQGERRD